MGAEDVGDFKGGPPHGIDLWSGQKLQRAHHLAQHGGRDVRIDRCRLTTYGLQDIGWTISRAELCPGSFAATNGHAGTSRNIAGRITAP
jgi:hypothetical protein